MKQYWTFIDLLNFMVLLKMIKENDYFNSYIHESIKARSSLKTWKLWTTVSFNSAHPWSCMQDSNTWLSVSHTNVQRLDHWIERLFTKRIIKCIKVLFLNWLTEINDYEKLFNIKESNNQKLLFILLTQLIKYSHITILLLLKSSQPVARNNGKIWWGIIRSYYY